MHVCLINSASEDAETFPACVELHSQSQTVFEVLDKHASTVKKIIRAKIAELLFRFVNRQAHTADSFIRQSSDQKYGQFIQSLTFAGFLLRSCGGFDDMETNICAAHPMCSIRNGSPGWYA